MSPASLRAGTAARPARRRACPSGSRRSSRRGARRRDRGTGRTRRRPRSRRGCRCRRSARPSRPRAPRDRRASRTSHGRATAPSRPRSSPLRDASPSFTPCASSAVATAAPMPRLAPVMTAILPSSDVMCPPEVEVRDRARGIGRSPARTRRPTRDRARSARVTRTRRGDRLVRRRRTCRPRPRRAAPRRTPSLRRSRCARAAGRAPRRRSEARDRCARRRRRPEPIAARTPSVAQQLERVAQAVGDALQHRARSAPRSWRSESPTNAPRASGSACGVRSPARYGANSRPSAPGAQRSASAVERVVGLAGRGDVAQPAKRAGGGEHHAHRVPAARHRVAEGVHAALGVRGVAGQRGEDDARGSEHDRERPGPVDADAERAGGLVARARRDGNPAGVARHVRRLEHARQPLGGDLERREDLVAPAPLRDVEEQRPRRVRRRRSRARRSSAAGRSPSAAARGRSARRPRARGGAATGASAP